MEILAIMAQKGGTGKTTTAAALADAAEMHGKKNSRTLLIDLDAQGNLTLITNADTEHKGNVIDFLEGTKPLKDIVQQIDRKTDLIAASWDIASLQTYKGSAHRLEKALQPIVQSGKYDLIIIDAPPQFGEIQYNVLQAATGVIIPLEADVLSLQCMYQLADTVKAYQENSNPNIKIKGIVFTKYDNRSTLAKQMRENIANEAAALNIADLGNIRPGIAIKEAQTLQQNLFNYAPKSKPAQDYLALYKKVIK